jgi:hypothetical protein
MYLLPQALYTHYHGAQGKGFASSVLSNINGGGTSPDGIDYVSGPFQNFSGLGSVVPAIASAALTQKGPFGVYVDTTTTAGSVLQSITEVGVARLVTGTTTGHTSAVLAEGGVGISGIIPNAASPVVMLFETEIRRVSTGNLAIFAGFSGAAVGANQVLDGPGALASLPFVGFVTTDNGASLNVAYRHSSGAAFTRKVLDMPVNPLGGYLPVEMGVVIRGRQRSEAVLFYANGELVHSLDSSVLGLAGFPIAQAMRGVVGVKTLAAAASEIAVSRMAAITKL